MGPAVARIVARHSWVLWAILGAALAARLFLALTSVYLWDEDREWIRLASTISFDPAAPHLPIQGITHPVVPAYFMHLGSVLLGENPLGFRVLSVLAGVLTVLAGYRIASRLGGAVAGAVTAAALAFNEYHVLVSSVAVDMVFYLLFSMLALGAFLRFLEEPKPWLLALVALANGAGYLCNERAALLLPVWCVALVLTGNARWFLRWQTWAALLLFVAVISPDLAKGWLQDFEATQASHTEHFNRISGIGVTAQPLAFYGKDAVRQVLKRAGVGFKDWAPEYPAMNVVLGLSLLAGAGAALLWRKLRSDPAVRTCLALLAFVMALLTFVSTTYNEEANLAPQAWYWADLSLLPAALLAGITAGRLPGWPRRLIVLGVAAGCLVASARIAGERLGTFSVKAGAIPGLLSPADGRLVPVRTGFLTCYLCDPDPAIALEKVEVRDRGTWRPARPGEDFVPEGKGRHLALRASPEALYALHFVVRAKGGEETAVAFDIGVRDAPSRYPPPFWLPAATARGAPSPPRAGGS